MSVTPTFALNNLEREEEEEEGGGGIDRFATDDYSVVQSNHVCTTKRIKLSDMNRNS